MYVEPPTDPATQNPNWFAEAVTHANTACLSCSAKVKKAIVLVVHIEECGSDTTVISHDFTAQAHVNYITHLPDRLTFEEKSYEIASVILRVGNDAADPHFITLRKVRTRDAWVVFDCDKSYFVLNEVAESLFSGVQCNSPEWLSEHEGEAIKIDSVFYCLSIVAPDEVIERDAALPNCQSQDVEQDATDAVVEVLPRYFSDCVITWSLLKSNTVQWIASKAATIHRKIAGQKRLRNGDESIATLNSGQQLVMHIVIMAAIIGDNVPDFLIEIFSTQDAAQNHLMFTVLLTRLSWAFQKSTKPNPPTVFSSSNGVFGAHVLSAASSSLEATSTFDKEYFHRYATYAVSEELRAFPREVMQSLIECCPNVLEAACSIGASEVDQHATSTGMGDLNDTCKKFCTDLLKVASQRPRDSTVLEMCMGLESRSTPGSQSQSAMFRLIEVSVNLLAKRV